MTSPLDSLPDGVGWLAFVVLCAIVAVVAVRVVGYVLPRTGASKPGQAPRVSRPVLAALAIVLSGGVLAFTGLMDGVREHNDLSRYDPTVHAAVIADRTPLLTRLGESATFLASQAVLVTFTIVLVAALFWRRHRLAAGVVAGTMILSAALTVGLKLLVGRTRPATADLIGPIDTGYSFPSGHTLNATVFFGLLAGLALTRVRSAAGRYAIGFAWVVACAAVAGSRLYLGYHWLTDVLAGWSVGVAILALACAAYLVVRSRLRPRRDAVSGRPEAPSAT